MVSTATLACMAASALISILGPVAALIVARRRLSAPFRSIAAGALVFVVCALVFERLFNMVALSCFPCLQTSPFAFTLFVALTAGVFEELGRAAGFIVMRRSSGADDGLPGAIGLGIGHAGVEAIVVGGFIMIEYIIISLAINAPSGRETILASVSAAKQQLAIDQIHTLTDTAPWFFLIMGFERAVTFGLQLTCSVLVWMVVSGRIGWGWIAGAVALHAMFGAGAGLYRTQAISLWQNEAWAVVGLIVTIAVTLSLYRSARRGAVSRGDRVGEVDAAEPAATSRS